MERHEKVADRAGTLVTERVRDVIDTAQARAERARRNADDEARRLDAQRLQAASRIVSEIEELEGALGRLREQMGSEHVDEASYFEEPRMIEAASEDEAEVVEEPAEEVAEEPIGEEASRSSDVSPEPTEARGSQADEAPVSEEAEASKAEASQATRFSFLRRRERQGGEEDTSETPDPEQASAAQTDEADTQECAVCGRGFAGDETELKSLGWVIADSGEVTCADCHSAGWLRPSV